MEGEVIGSCLHDPSGVCNLPIKNDIKCLYLLVICPCNVPFNIYIYIYMESYGIGWLPMMSDVGVGGGRVFFYCFDTMLSFEKCVLVN